MKNWLSKLIKREEIGAALPIVLAMLALGSLLIVPSLNYVATSVKTGGVMEKNMEGLYAADTGVEDALWKLKYDEPASFPYSYQLTDINGMSVNVVIEEVTTLFGEELVEGGGHSDWLVITKTITYDAGIYYFTLSLTNEGEGNMKIEKIVLDLPHDLEYVDGSTGGDLSDDDDLTVNGDSSMGITLIWDIPVPHPTISEGATKNHTFQLSGPPGVEGVEGHGFVQSTRDDVGTVWDGDLYPFSITAQAKDTTDTVVATIHAGVWKGSELSISCWQVNP